MSGKWLADAILRSASWLAPAERREEWLEEWRSELWYVPRRGATRFCLGAFRDAAWVRQNSPPARRGYWTSAGACVAFLTILPY
jgi:hypothetical protein